MSSAHLPATPDDPHRPVIDSPSLPEFMDELRNYRAVLDSHPDLALVNACIHQLEERKELLKKDRDNADTKSIWLQNQAVWAMTIGLPGLLTTSGTVAALLRGHLPKYVAPLVMLVGVIVGIFLVGWIRVALFASTNSAKKPKELTENAKELGSLLASFRILKDRLETDARKADTRHRTARRGRLGRSR